jgi:hypothetical protein
MPWSDGLTVIASTANAPPCGASLALAAPPPDELAQHPLADAAGCRTNGERVVADLRVVSAEPGELVCRVGRP